jgi:hypothetical protein
VGTDTASRTIIQFAVDDWTLEKLLAFDADAVELEDGGDDKDRPPVVMELVRPKVVRRRRALASGHVG